MDYINESLKTPVFGEYDVVVAGAGPAGVCAVSYTHLACIGWPVSSIT